MNIIAIVEVVGGMLLIALCAAACWNENKLITWEEKHLLPLLRRVWRFIRNKLCRPEERTADK